MRYTRSFKGRGNGFGGLKTLLAKASPRRSADELAALLTEDL
jgi:ethanolamine ammonia-lyase large subunit